MSESQLRHSEGMVLQNLKKLSPRIEEIRSGFLRILILSLVCFHRCSCLAER